MVEEANTSIPSTGKKRLSPRGRQTILQIVVGMSTLVCGIIIGLGVALLLLKDKIDDRPRGPLPPIEAIIDDVKARYDLTEEQVQEVTTTFANRRETLRTIFDEFRTKSEAEFKNLAADIKKILTPEQYVRWEEDFKRRRRPGPRRDRGRGGPGDKGFGRRGPGDRPPDGWGSDGEGRRRDFGEGGRRSFHDRPGRGYRGRGRGPWDPNKPDPNMPMPPVPESNEPADP